MENLPKQSNLEENLYNLKINLPLFIQYETIMAHVKRAKYLAMIKEGFSEEQALKLCMEVKI